ncbi:MAG: hypothetical protein HY843_09280 [Bdellovibrio sp.]|nr:hypothetical protein [Bdellovibrio sp.]
MDKKITVLITCIVFLNLSCGGAYFESKNVSQTDSLVQQDSVSQNDLSNSGTQNSPSNPSDTTPSSDDQNKPPLISAPILKVGHDDPFTYDVRVNKVLKVKFTPGQADRKIANTGYTANYSMLAVFISVGTNEIATPLLNNGLTDTQETSEVMDFSSSFTKTCPDSTPSCRQTVTISVKKPNYDYWCFNFGMYCSHTHVWPTHPWNGKILIQTDDTKSME